MSPNQKTTVAIIGILALAFVGDRLINQKYSNNNISSDTNSQSLSQNSGSMDDHHKPQPSNSVVFNSLLGVAAPDFNLEGYDGRKYQLSELKGKNVLLFFNEGLMCYPACWNQMVAFGNDKDLLSKTVILNITADPKNKWQEAVNKMPELAKATVLFDSNKTISTKYGVLGLESSMHKGVFPGHTYVLIDKEGIVRYLKDDPQMAVRNTELLSEVNKLP